MSVKAMTWAWEQDLKPNLKFVLVSLADHSDGNGVCWPGHDLIAEKCGLSRQTVVVNIQALEADGYVVAERAKDAKGRVCKTRYFLCLDRASRRPDGVPAEPPESGESMSGNPTRLHVGKADTVHVGFSGESMSGLPVPYKEEPKAFEPKPPNPLLLSPDELPEKRHHENTFEQLFWPRYPKHVGKQDALAVWLKLAPDDALLEAIKLAISRRKTIEAEALAKGAFVAAWPDPKRWLAKRRWEDVLPAPIGGSTGNTRPPCSGCGKPSVLESEGKAWCRSCNPLGREAWAKRGGVDGRAGAR